MLYPLSLHDALPIYVVTVLDATENAVKYRIGRAIGPGLIVGDHAEQSRGNGQDSITPALLSVIANNKTRTYGAANPVFDGILSGIQNGDNIDRKSVV